jgi:hypothetical protein
MLRTIGGVLGGYVTMFMLVFITFTIAYLAMGADGAFKPGSYEVTTLWIVATIALGLIAAIVGGIVCSAIAKNSKAVLALAGLVLVLGLLSAVPALTTSSASETKVRAGDVGNMEAMMNAKQPAWIALLNPLIGVAGVMIGGRFRSSANKT